MTDKTEWVMVPSKWTPEMLQAAINYGGWRPERWQETWNQVLAAAPTPPGQDPREFPLDRMAENARELGLDYTPQDVQAQIDALKAERDGIFNLLRKCAHAMDAGRIDVDLIEEVRATLPDTKEKP